MNDPAPIKVKALELGFTTVGVCDAVPPPHFEAYEDWIRGGNHAGMAYLKDQMDLKKSPQSLLPEARSIVVVTLNYNQPLDHARGHPKFARYALGRDYHRVLRGKLKKLASFIDEIYPEAKNRICVDSAPILERDYAQMAGLGWFGKNTLLIDSKRGSYFFIGMLLTSIPLVADGPAAGGCGTCHKCVEACPTGAIIFANDHWQVNARNCISYLTIEHRGSIDESLAEKIGEWTFGCDICQEVCPFNEPRPSQPMRARVTGEPGLLSERPWPNLKDMVKMSAEDWDKMTTGSAIRRAGYRGLMRNAEINLRASSAD
jgi:epoxyqueuosine reductase